MSILDLMGGGYTTSNYNGMFSALSGKSSSSASQIFNPTTMGNASPSIDQILKRQQYNNTKNNYITNIAARVQALAKNQLTPNADWERIAGYAAQTGKPLSISIDNKNKIQADTQMGSNNIQANALESVNKIAQEIQANQKNTNMLNELSNSEFTISNVASSIATPTADWQSQGAALVNSNKPFNTFLDNSGKITVQDQMFDPMSNLDIASQKLLRKAISDIPKIISTQTYTQSWHVDAANFAQQKTPYHLSIDPITKQISALENNATNIVPSFLKDPPYPDLKLDTQWKKDAANMIQNNKPYFLDFSNNKIVVKEINPKNLIDLLNPNTAKPAGTVLDYLT